LPSLYFPSDNDICHGCHGNNKGPRINEWQKTFVLFNLDFEKLLIGSLELFAKIPRGVLAIYMTGGPTELHIVNPNKIHEPEILHQKKTWHQNFPPKKIQDLNTSILMY